MSNMTESPATTPIPVQLSEPEFIAFIFPHLSMPRRGPKCKLGYHRVFNLILWVLYTGMQWKCLPVPRAGDGTAVIHYTTIYKVFAKWSDVGSLDQAFIASVRHLAEQHHLDLSVLHGDGSNTVAKKGGDGIGYSGHKHQKGEKVLAIVENNGFVLAPLPVAPVNEADTVLLPDGLNALKRVARLTDLKIDGCRVEVPVARHLPHRSRRAAFPHRAPAEGRTRPEFGAWAAHTPPIRRLAASVTCRVRLCVRGVRCCLPSPRPAAFPPPSPPPTLRSALFEASRVSGRRRRARLLSRWPPSAAQTGRAVFPHPAFMNGLSRSEERGSVKQGQPIPCPPESGPSASDRRASDDRIVSLKRPARQQSWPVVLPHPGMLPDGLGIASSECSRRSVTLSIGDPFGIRVLRPEGSVTWGHLTIIHRGEP